MSIYLTNNIKFEMFPSILSRKYTEEGKGKVFSEAATGGVL